MKKLILSIILSLFVATTSWGMTCLEPGPVEGYEYLSFSYDPVGNVVVQIDRDADGKSDFSQIFVLMKNQTTGEVFFMPHGPAMTPEMGNKLVKKGREINRSLGHESKCYDTDTKQLRLESDRWADKSE